MATAPLILTIDDLQIVSIYKYLGIWLDEKLPLMFILIT